MGFVSKSEDEVERQNDGIAQGSGAVVSGPFIPRESWKRWAAAVQEIFRPQEQSADSSPATSLSARQEDKKPESAKKRSKPRGAKLSSRGIRSLIRKASGLGVNGRKFEILSNRERRIAAGGPAAPSKSPKKNKRK